MPSCRGTVHDEIHRRSFTMELEGPKATLVYVWNQAHTFQERNMVIRNVPTIMAWDTRHNVTSNTGDVKECNVGSYILSDLHLEDVKFPTVGMYFDRRQLFHFEKQAYLCPFPSQARRAKSYQENGVLTLEIRETSPVREDSDLRFPIVVTELGHILDLPTPYPPFSGNSTMASDTFDGTSSSTSEVVSPFSLA